MTPLALTDAQLAAVRDIANLIPPWRRDEYLRELAHRLRGVEIGDGSVRNVAVATMREILARARESRWVSGGEEGA